MHREERADPGRGHALGQGIEFRLGRKARVENAIVERVEGPRHHLGQPMIGLRTEHDIDKRRPPPDLLALGLGDAPRHRDQHSLALPLARPFQAADCAEFREHLLRRLFADVTGVQDDQIGTVGARRREIAEGRHQICHSCRVINVHLTAKGLDKQTLLHRHL